jgi:hypothetical protein
MCMSHLSQMCVDSIRHWSGHANKVDVSAVFIHTKVLQQIRHIGCPGSGSVGVGFLSNGFNGMHASEGHHVCHIGNTDGCAVYSVFRV